MSEIMPFLQAMQETTEKIRGLGCTDQQAQGVARRLAMMGFSDAQSAQLVQVACNYVAAGCGPSLMDLANFASPPPPTWGKRQKWAMWKATRRARRRAFWGRVRGLWQRNE